MVITKLSFIFNYSPRVLNKPRAFGWDCSGWKVEPFWCGKALESLWQLTHTTTGQTMNLVVTMSLKWTRAWSVQLENGMPAVGRRLLRAESAKYFIPVSNLLCSLEQGFSTFWYLRTPKSLFYFFAYPLNKVLTLCVPPYHHWCPILYR
jgi:hypothetical protein